jgi:hypothetical protein
VLILSSLVIFAGGCKKSEPKETAAPEIKPIVTHTEKAALQKAEPKLMRELIPYKYSDKSTWENGINQKLGLQFFISIPKETLLPVKPGFVLQFAGAGEATVMQVGRLESPEYSSVFITVDKKLDPERDGNPHLIQIKRFYIQAAPMNVAGNWRNGINLTYHQMFLFCIETKDQTPIQIGDQIEFPKSGAATVTVVKRENRQDGFANVTVTVDKPLDPDGDGYPRKLTVIVPN